MVTRDSRCATHAADGHAATTRAGRCRSLVADHGEPAARPAGHAQRTAAHARCCQVSGPFMRPRDSWEDIIEKHRLKEKEKRALLAKKKPIFSTKKDE